MLFLAFTFPVKGEQSLSIVPGKKMGHYPLNVTISSLNLGKPSSVKVLPNGYVVEKYDGKGLVVQYSQSDKLVRFIGVSCLPLNSTLYETKEGIRNGMFKDEIDALAGPPVSIVQVVSKDLYPNSQIMAVYGSSGFSVHYDASGRAVLLIVFDPAVFIRR